MGSKNFCPALFTDPVEYEETPLRDRKQKLYNLRHDLEKAEFLRDVIAMANTARAWGKRAHLLFGLDDKGNICDITNDLQPYLGSGHLPHSEEEYRDAMENKVRHEMATAIQEYIAPPLITWDVEWGQINGRLVAYLYIDPPQSPMQTAFHVARELQSGKNSLLRKGQCWIRQGESKFEIKREVLDLNSPGYWQVPLISPSSWLRYFEQLRSSREIDQAARKDPYIELYTDNDVPLSIRVEEFLASNESLLLIEGVPGSGKSTFLRRTVARWAETGIAAMQAIRQREEFAPPPEWIPVYLQIKSTNIENLAKEILREVNAKGGFWRSEPCSPENLLEGQDLHWLVCFDGLDELESERQVEQFLNTVRTLCRRYPRLKVLISTRPRFSVPDMPVARIKPLREDQIKNYLQAFVSDRNELIHQQLERGLSDSQSELYPLREICATPLYLEALVSTIAPDTLVAESLLEPSTSTETEQISEFSLPSTQEEMPTTFVPKPITIKEIQGPTDDILVPESSGDTGQEPLEGIPSSESGGDTESDQQEAAEEFPPLTLGWVLDRMVRRVWEREVERRVIDRSKPDQWRSATGKLGLKMDGHRRFIDEESARRVYSSREGLRWVLNLGILRYERAGIRFSHSHMQYYFSADYLRRNPESQDKWRQWCEPEFWQAVRKILEQITYA